MSAETKLESASSVGKVVGLGIVAAGLVTVALFAYGLIGNSEHSTLYMIVGLAGYLATWLAGLLMASRS